MAGPVVVPAVKVTWAFPLASVEAALPIVPRSVSKTTRAPLRARLAVVSLTMAVTVEVAAPLALRVSGEAEAVIVTP